MGLNLTYVFDLTTAHDYKQEVVFIFNVAFET